MDDCSFGLILLRLFEEMYIQKAEITNIKSIEHFEIEFPNPAGWHVLIGDNGSGKSTIVRAMALALVGETQAQGLREDWSNWVRKGVIPNKIEVSMYQDLDLLNHFERHISFEPDKLTFNGQSITFLGEDVAFGTAIITKVDNITETFFSSAFGPYRRFEGGNDEWDKIFNSPTLANLVAHLSIFNESVALTEPIRWLKSLFNTSNDPTLTEKEKIESLKQLENIKKLINSDDFLPNNTKLEIINSKDIQFKDGNDAIISVNQMSDGYRSILSLTFELIRQLVRVYGAKLVFENIEKGKMFIDLPGVVLVDEIDAHLHPTWQTRIGNWFLKYFPNLQFIVTTHSPLVCRASEKGSIWRLKAPGSDEESGEITGLDRERLIYGNVLDAYGTGVFGENTSISEDSNEMLNRLADLNVKSLMGSITKEESLELQQLRAKFPTENEIKL
jgi:energy-coupling factor transporter ATP-binding protein EcfA2